MELFVHISEKRLKPYLDLTHQARSKALELYWLDRKFASVILEDISYLEVALRNSINRVLCQDFGDNWYTKQLGFDERVVKNIADTWDKLPARYKDKKSPRNATLGGRVVAGSMFRTWTNMLDAGGSSGMPAPFEKSDHNLIWTRQRLIATFPGANALAQTDDQKYQTRGLSRAWVHEKVLRVHWLRNRVAHHESLVNGLPVPGSSQGERIPRENCVRDCEYLAQMLDRDLYDFLLENSEARTILALFDELL